MVGRLFPQVLSGEKTSTIRWRETPIRPGPMRYVCADDASRTTVVVVRKCTSMPLYEAAAFLGRGADWPPDVMLDGMREHYPAIELTDIVDVIEHDPPDTTQAATRPIV